MNRPPRWAWWTLLFLVTYLADYWLTLAGKSMTLDWEEKNPIASAIWADTNLALMLKLVGASLILLFIAYGHHWPQLDTRIRTRAIPALACFFLALDAYSLWGLWYWWHP